MTQYFMPAEWETHRATLLAWPHNKEDWPDKFEPIPWVFVEIIRYLTRNERVMLLVKNGKQEASAREMLERGGANLKKIDFLTVKTDRIWMRDAGPIWVKSNPKKAKADVILDFNFNAWAKYPNHLHDDLIPTFLEPVTGLERVVPIHKRRRVVLEGGAIDVNGKGALLTTEECLLSKKQCRNPGFTKDDYAEVFNTYLGIDEVIWLDKGIIGDDTHGHVDDLARFVNDNTIVTVIERDKKDANYALLQENLKRLKKTRYNIVELPMPKAFIFEGERLPASYANFLIANNQVLVPTFNDPMDRIALNILAECFPKHEIVGIHCGDFIWGLGTIHCASQQVPL